MKFVNEKRGWTCRIWSQRFASDHHVRQLSLFQLCIRQHKFASETKLTDALPPLAPVKVLKHVNLTKGTQEGRSQCPHVFRIRSNTRTGTHTHVVSQHLLVASYLTHSHAHRRCVSPLPSTLKLNHTNLIIVSQLIGQS